MGHPLISTSLGMPALPVSPITFLILISVPVFIGAWVLAFVRARRLDAGFGRHLIALVFALLAVMFLALHVHYFPQGVDDSFISYRYAENLAAGKGFVFNEGERVEGFSNPFWVMLLAFLAKLGINLQTADWAMPLAAKLLGVVCHFVIFVWLFIWSTPPGSTRARYYAALAGLAFLFAAGTNTYWAVSGMETMHHALLVLYLVTAWYRPGCTRTPDSPLLVFGSSALLVISRPEGAMFGVVVLLLWAIADRRQRSRLSPSWMISAALFALVLIAVESFRVSYFGMWLPNTFYAKATGDAMFQWQHGLQYIGSALLMTGGWLWLVLARRAVLDVKRADSMIAALVIAQAAFIFWVGGDWMAGYRFWAPMIPLGAIAIISFLSEKPEWIEKWIGQRAGLVRSWVTVAVLLFLIGLQALAFDRAVYVTNDYFVSGLRRLDLYYEQQYYEAALELRDRLQPDDLVALGEAGLVPYLSGARTLDVYGLLNPEIAHLPGRVHEKGGAQVVLARRPEYLLIAFLKMNLKTGDLVGWSPFDERLLASADFREHYREVWRNDRFVLFRRGTPL